MVRPTGSLTDVAGILVGHWTDSEALTGCTVVMCERPFVASCDVRGGAPGTRETDLLLPGRLVERADAIVLAGGSAFGLAAADGVMQYLREQGRGHPTASLPVPIVPAAIIYDLDLGRPAWPTAASGHEAAAAARREFGCGCVGAGTGATVGKMLGPGGALKSGLGTASLTGPGGLVVGALAVVNSLGNVVDPDSGATIAGARPPAGGGSPSVGNTLLAVVATNAQLDRAQTWRLAQTAHDGMALAVRPVHTLYDGDTVFTLATGEVMADPVLTAALAVKALAAAIVHAVQSATGAGGLPAARDLARADRE